MKEPSRLRRLLEIETAMPSGLRPDDFCIRLCKDLDTNTKS
jgi:hypothetical protein